MHISDKWMNEYENVNLINGWMNEYKNVNLMNEWMNIKM